MLASTPSTSCSPTITTFERVNSRHAAQRDARHMTGTDSAHSNVDMSTPENTRTSVWTMLAYGTSLVDAYLALASVASRMMENTSSSYLPPINSEANTEGTRFFTLMVATCTAAIALGCLWMCRPPTDGIHAAGAAWFVALCSTTWLTYLSPFATGILKHLFFYGPYRATRGLPISCADVRVGRAFGMGR